MNIPLIAKKNIKENESKMTENMKKINNILNSDFIFECNLEDLYNAASNEHKNEIGSVVYDKYLGNLAKNMSEQLADELSLEAFIDATPSKKISISIDNLSSGYVKSKFIDGTYHVVIKSSNFPCNFHEAGADIERSL